MYRIMNYSFWISDYKQGLSWINTLSNMILDNVSMKLDSGKIYGLQGPNGSGKTMLLRLMAEIKNRAGEKEIREALKDAGLDPDDKRTFSKYSLGMKQRLGIASCLMEKPELILMDEPTNALDETGVKEICMLIRREKERGALIVIASHDADVLEGLAEEIYTVYDGCVSQPVEFSKR